MNRLLRGRRRPGWGAVPAGLLLAALLTGGPPRAGAQQPTSIDTITIGTGGWIKVGKWTPISVTFEATRGGEYSLAVTAQDPTGQLATYTRPPITIGGPAGLTLGGQFQMGALGGELLVQLIRDGEEFARRSIRLARRPATPAAFSPVTIEQSRLLWITCGLPAELAESEAKRAGVGEGPEDRIVVALDGALQLPVQLVDLDAVDGILIAGASGYRADPIRSGVLADWVAEGGHLVVAVGSEREAWGDSPLSTWIPVRVTGGRQLNDGDLRGLETFVGHKGRIPFQGRFNSSVLVAADGRTLVEAPGGPLIAQAAHGLGRVTMLAVDIAGPPLSNWSALSKLFERLLIGAADTQDDTLRSRRRGALAHSGITDLKTQLLATQDDFPQVRRFQIWQVLVLVVLFLVVVGPLDYLLVHHVLKRPRATWLTLPTVIAVTVAGACWAAGATNRREMLIKQLDLVDIDSVNRRVTLHTWATLYAGGSRRYRIEVSPADWARDDDGPEGQVGWSGVPEKTFGGMYRSGQPSVDAADGYRVETDPAAARVEGLPVSIWSSRTIAATWRSRPRSLVTSTLKSTGVGHLAGEIVHELPGEIDEWLLAYENKVYRSSRQRTERLLPGEKLQLDGGQVRSRSLREFLTGTYSRRVARKGGFGTDVRTYQVLYDRENLDQSDLLQILTFHVAAGGRRYTGLDNHDLVRFDLSPLITLDRAVLLGRLVSGTGTGPLGAVVSVDGNRAERDAGRLQQSTFVRIVMPVLRRIVIKKSIADPSELNFGETNDR